MVCSPIKRIKTVVLLLLLCLIYLPTSVQAEDFNYGFKLVYFEIDLPKVDDPDNIGFVVSYDRENEYGTLGIEGELTTTYLEGKIANSTVELDTAGIYGSYRSNWRSETGVGPYYKAKAGVAYSDLKLGNDKQSDLNFSAGIGIGLNLKSISVELEYTLISTNIDMVNLLIRF